MSKNLDGKLVIAISSRALFNLDEANALFEAEGVEAYTDFQIAHEEDILEPGVAFPLVKKLLALSASPETQNVEVILLSRNSADTGLRVFNSIRHYGLNITRAVFTRGGSTHRYVPAFGAHLFLSANPDDVRHALNAGYAAATILPSNTGRNATDELRLAFDGDSVIFSDEAERVFKEHGLQKFTASEVEAARRPLPGGPFAKFLVALHNLQAGFPPEECPIRTALVTARAAPAHERVIRTLRAMNIRIDEAIFLGGLAKGQFLEAFGADIFFDDQHAHCDSACRYVATGHVPHGIANVAAILG